MVSSSPYLLVEVLLQKHLMLLEHDVRGVTADFGSGDFRFTKGLLGKAAAVYAIDNWVAAKYHENVPQNVIFYYASAEKAPFATNAFDTVICTEVLEHVADPDRLLAECTGSSNQEACYS